MVKIYEYKKTVFVSMNTKALIYIYKCTQKYSHMDEYTGKVKYIPFTNIPLGEHKHKRHDKHKRHGTHKCCRCSHACKHTYAHTHTCPLT